MLLELPVFFPACESQLSAAFEILTGQLISLLIVEQAAVKDSQVRAEFLSLCLL